jgi:mono/diheme cytochrome c family protein
MKTLRNFTLLSVIFILTVLITGCSSKQEDIGIGPVKKVTIGALDNSQADKGKEIFDMKCITCHKFDTKLVGPALNGITQRRKPEWIMNMILNPEQMTKEDKTAKQLFTEHLVQMTFQNVTQDEARAILEYFRKNDGAK